MSGFLFSDSKSSKKVINHFGFRFKRIPVAMFAAVLMLLTCMAGAGTDTLRSDDPPSAGLYPGFRRLYDLDFAGAQKEFETWEKVNPQNPMGPVSDAAAVLFSEFNRLGVLEAQFL